MQPTELLVPTLMQLATTSKAPKILEDGEAMAEAEPEPELAAMGELGEADTLLPLISQLETEGLASPPAVYTFMV